MKRKLKFKKLTIMFSTIIFFIILITMIFMTLIVFIFSKLHLIHATQSPHFFGFVIFIAILSTVTGTIISLITSRIPLKPIRQLIAATKQLAQGDFSARIHLEGPDEILELTDSFNRMAEELGSVEILRNDFINNFSHEFKTPIVSLRGFAKLLKNEHLTKEEREEYLDIIISESNRLSVLATNVLNLTKIENQSILINSEQFNLSEQIRKAILLLESKWSAAKINMIISIDETTFFANEELLNQVWINLIDNAIKFSNEGGTITIKLINYDDFILFKITDHGCGMNNETLTHIFDRFYQGDTSHTTAGNGLGLTIAKKIVALYNGELSVKSKRNEGSIFSVKLPKS